MKKPLLWKHVLTLWMLALAIMLAAASSRTWAGEQRHHDAHVHGISHLNVAAEKDSIHL